MIGERPGPGAAREYRFPRSFEHTAAGGLRVIVVPMPARPLASVQLLLPGGAAGEPADGSGLTAALARLLTEGGERHDADGLVEASEVLGAKIGAEAGWESVVIGASLPASRLAGILELIAEIALAPRLPEREIERVKALRLAAIEQAHASPRSRASEALIAEMRACGFTPACTPFDEPSVQLIEELGVDVVKVASASFTDWPLLERVVRADKPVVASTATATLDEIRVGINEVVLKAAKVVDTRGEAVDLNALDEDVAALA